MVINIIRLILLTRPTNSKIGCYLFEIKGWAILKFNNMSDEKLIFQTIILLIQYY